MNRNMTSKLGRILEHLSTGSLIYITTILAGLVSALWFGEVASHGLDAHHQGFMGRTAVDIFSGRTLYAQTWSFYQPLPQYLNALSLVIFGEKIISIQYMTVLGYALCSMGVTLLSHRLGGYRATFLAVAVFLASSPEVVQFVSAKLSAQPIWAIEMIMLPWPSVWALAFGLFAMRVGIKIINYDQPRITDLTILGILIGLTAASRLFSGVFLLIASIAVILFFCAQAKRRHLVFLTAIAFTTLTIFYLPSLMKMTIKELWAMQIGDASSFAVKGKSLTDIAHTYLSYFAEAIKLGNALFVSTLLIAAGYSKTQRTFTLITANTLVTAFTVSVFFSVLVHHETIWNQFLAIYSLNENSAICFALIAGFSIYKSRQANADMKWRISAVVGVLAVVLMLVGLAGYESFSYKIVSESQNVWPNILMAFSALALLILVYPMVANGKFFAHNFNKELLTAITLGIPALSQLFPVFEARHIFWSCIPLATVAISLAVKPPIPVPIGRINFILLTMMLIAPFSTTAIGYYERQIMARVQLNSGNFFDGMKIDPGVHKWLSPLMQSVEGYESKYPNTPLLFLGHNVAFGLMVNNKTVPNGYSLQSYNYTNDKEAIVFQQFVNRNKPIFWLEGYFVSQSADRKLIPESYCKIESSPPVDNITSFDDAIFAPCHQDNELGNSPSH